MADEAGVGVLTPAEGLLWGGRIYRDVEEDLAKDVRVGARWKRPSVPVSYYDNLEATPIDGISCLVEVERVYGLDWDRFDDHYWRGLARVYEELPGAVRLRDVPWWFGDDEDVSPFLWASGEPLGLQVYGNLLKWCPFASEEHT